MSITVKNMKVREGYADDTFGRYLFLNLAKDKVSEVFCSFLSFMKNA
jgi:hypothetical protein